MKFLILYTFLLISLNSFSQLRGLAVTAQEFAVSYGFEYPKLKGIADIQKDIALYQTAIAAEQGYMLSLEKELYDGLSKKDKFIDGLQIIIKITDSQLRINKWLKNTAKMANKNPSLKKAFNKQKFLVVAKATGFVADIIVATKEDKSNLMNNKQRYEILRTILKNIQEVEKHVKGFYYLFKDIERSSTMNNFEHSKVDFSGIFKELESTYDTLFPEEIKE